MSFKRVLGLFAANSNQLLSKTPINGHVPSLQFADQNQVTSDLGRHFFHADNEKALNEQIGCELQACYCYLTLTAYFGQTQVALPGCYAFFHQMHLEELGHAHKLMRYQNMRGGRVSMVELKPTVNLQDMNIEKSLLLGLEMEKHVKNKLIGVYNVAEKHCDLSLMDYIVTEFLTVQERSIQEYARLLNRYKSMAGCGMCSCIDFLFDKELHKVFSKGASDKDVILTSEEKEYK